MKTIIKGTQVSSQGQWKTLICRLAVQVFQPGAETSLSCEGLNIHWCHIRFMPFFECFHCCNL